MSVIATPPRSTLAILSGSDQNTVQRFGLVLASVAFGEDLLPECVTGAVPDLQRQQLQRLSVTRNLATLLGGTVTVASEPLVGSTFRIVLPRSRPD